MPRRIRSGRRPAARFACAACVTLAAAGTGRPCWSFELPTVGGHEGEIDATASVAGVFGAVEPSGRATTHSSADIKRLNVGAGFTFGDAGPLKRVRLGLTGSYFISAREQLRQDVAGLPPRPVVAPEDKAGRVDASIGAFLVDTPRYALRVRVDGAVPLDVDLAKFSQERLHYVSGSVSFHTASHPGAWLSVGSHTTALVGSGAYGERGRHNPQFRAATLLSLDLAEWIFPWRVGVALGPTLEVDLAGHTNRYYRAAFALESPPYQERVLALQVGGRVAPYLFITDDAALELSFEGVSPASRDVRGTQRYRAGLRVAF